MSFELQPSQKQEAGKIQNFNFSNDMGTKTENNLLMDSFQKFEENKDNQAFEVLSQNMEKADLEMAQKNKRILEKKLAKQKAKSETGKKQKNGAIYMAMVIGLLIFAFCSFKFGTIKRDLEFTQQLANMQKLEMDNLKQQVQILTFDMGKLDGPNFFKGQGINAKDSNGYTRLYIASENGFLEDVKKLLELGADIDAKDNRQETPLHLAARNGHFEVVKMLLENGANITGENFLKIKISLLMSTTFEFSFQNVFIKLLENGIFQSIQNIK